MCAVERVKICRGQFDWCRSGYENNENGAPIGESRPVAASGNRVRHIHPDAASSVEIRLEPSRGREDMRAPSAKPQRYIREDRESPCLSQLFESVRNTRRRTVACINLRVFAVEVK